MTERRRLSRNVFWFGVVSFLTDASGEMIYPLLPLFLTTVLGGRPAWVGLIEGVAESTAALFKLVSGRLADATARKKPLVVAGYGLSSLVRPLVALATAPWMVLVVRFCDRAGKGVRSSPRDAMVAEATPQGQRGAAYGYHRAMDNAGAVIGPLVGFALMRGAGFELRSVFAWAALPGALAVATLVLGVRDLPATRPPAPAAPPQDPAAPQDGLAAPQQPARPEPLEGRLEPSLLPPSLRRYYLALAVFTLGNASDAFLLLRADAVGISTSRVLLLWTLHNLVKAALSRPLGALSDRVGRRGMIAAGWSLYALVYLGFALSTRPWQLWALFALYGVHYSLVEGPERALVADLAPEGHRGRAFGWFHAVVGAFALPASLLFGLLYQKLGPVPAFGTAAALAAAATALLATVPASEPQSGPP